MIVPMKNVALLALASEEEHALEQLRELGVMQLMPAERCSAATAESVERCAGAERLANQLAGLVTEDTVLNEVRDAAFGKAVVEKAAALRELRSETEMDLVTLKQRLNRLAVWGDFKRAMLEEFREKGVELLLCSGSRDDFKAVEKLPGISLFVIRSSRSTVEFAAVKNGSFSAEERNLLPVFKLAADDDPETLRSGAEKQEKQLAEIDRELETLAADLKSVRLYCDELAEKAEFDRAADAMKEHGEISVLRGYVPEPKIDILRETAVKAGWGLLIRDPGEDENVPVLLENNRFTSLVKPLFDFLGIAPGYREIDISGGVLIFFTIFYAIILGDAGYGLLFGAISLFGLAAAKTHPAIKTPMRLLLLLSVAATIWGALCGSWFGMSKIPWTDRNFPALECFRDFASSSRKQANIQLFCFILAVVQLSAGRIWRVIRERTWRAAGQHLGWMLIIWGNFFLTVRLIVYPGEFPTYMYGFYGAGLLLVMGCGVNWKNAADIFQFPFDVIGSFTDVLSYIRLFAVGLAGACIAGSFNGMAFDLASVSAWLIPAGVVVALLGHALNIALALLSVLVHAVRLNTLEFSNHTGLSWSGQSFNPFKKTDKNKE